MIGTQNRWSQYRVEPAKALRFILRGLGSMGTENIELRISLAASSDNTNYIVKFWKFVNSSYVHGVQLNRELEKMKTRNV